MSLRTKADNIQLDLAVEFRKLRESAGLTQAEAGEVVGGYDAKTVGRWENGDAKIRVCHVESLRSLSINSPNPTSPGRAFTFIDLFAGIGGLRMGFDAIGGQCVFTSEWDKHSQLTYKANFGAHEVHGDIVQIGSERIPDHDVLLAGFPCQPFSLAGVSKKNSLGRPHGFDCDTQGTLFFEVERIIKAKQPKVFLLENVKNLVNHDGGRTFATIKHTLATKLNYHVSAKIVDARCVVPQHRERIFIVGFRQDVPHAFDWESVVLPALKQGPRLNVILHPEDGTEMPESPFTMPNGKVNKKYILSEHLWQYLQGYAAKHQKLGNGFGFGLVGPDDVARTLSARYHKDGSEILVRRGNGRPRRLTPRECARLMGFDRPGRIFKLGQVSDTQAYRQFGNAVVVPVVEAIAQALRPHILTAVATFAEPVKLSRSA
jgi:DNA (cytosine-5)-methyltransferase 1